MPFADDAALLDHFDRHKKEFGFSNVKDYERAAEAFMLGPVREPVREGLRTFNGDRVRYDRTTVTLGVVSKTGFIKTFLRPKDKFRHKAYFQWECGIARTEC